MATFDSDEASWLVVCIRSGKALLCRHSFNVA